MAHDPVPADASGSAGGGHSVGLVLGAGGIAGWAWLVGCLAGLEEVAGWDARRADLIVGTSAGAGVAATLRGGRSAIDQLAAYTENARVAASSTPDPPQGASRPTRATAGPSTPGTSTPGTSTPGTGKLETGASTAGVRGSDADDGTDRSPETTEPLGAAAEAGARAAPVPSGSAAGGTMPAPARPPLIERLADDVSHRPTSTHANGPPATDGASATAQDGRRAWPQAPQLAVMALTHWPPRPGLALAGLLPRGRHSLDDLGGRLRDLHGHAWPAKPLWVTAIRAGTGRRVVFGRDPGSAPDVATAVRASAAVPGWYEPIRIGESDHLDGGSWSATNADLVAGLGFDVALILAPMSVATARLGRSKDRLRRAYHRSVLSREVDVVHRNGTDAVVLEPHPDDLALLAGTSDELDGARRLAIAQRARQRVLQRLGEDPSLVAALQAAPPPPRSEAGPRAEPGPRPTT